MDIMYVTKDKTDMWAKMESQEVKFHVCERFNKMDKGVYQSSNYHNTARQTNAGILHQTKIFSSNALPHYSL